MKKSNIAKIALVFILIEPMFAGPVQWVKSKVLHRKSNYTLLISSNPTPSGVTSQDTGSHTVKKRESKHFMHQTNQRVAASIPPEQVKSKKKISKKKIVQDSEKSLLASTSGVSLATAGFDLNDVRLRNPLNAALLRNPFSKQFRKGSQKTLEILKQLVITRPPLSELQLVSKAEGLEASAVNAINPNNPDYNGAIEKLLVARDAYNGIEQRIIQGQDGSSIRIRDARNPDVRTDENPRAAYGAQYLNQVRATEELIRSEGERAGLNPNDIGDRIQYLARRARANLQNILNSENPKEIIVDLNTDLTKLAINMGLKDLDKKIGWAKEFMNLDYEHYHTATVYTVEDREGKKHTVIESDVKMSGLTQDQRSRYGK